MNFDQFANLVQDIVSQYYEKLEQGQSENKLIFNSPILFPSMMIAYKFKDHYLAEFVGLSRKFPKIKIIKIRKSSADQYFHLADDSLNGYQFTQSLNPMNTHVGPMKFANMAFSQDDNFEEIGKRFPIIDMMGTKLIIQDRRLFDLSEGFISASLSNIIIVNKKGKFYRCKSILAAFLMSRYLTKNQMVDRLIDLFPKSVTPGDHVPYVLSSDNKSDTNILLASQLQNLYLSKNIRENTIGEFFNRHTDVVNRAFNTKHFIYEPYLEWMEHDGNITEVAINPDLMVRRDDGFYDIYDLKTAALGKRSLTRAPSSRRRPIDYVSEGLAQLANYAEYFAYEKNWNHAFAKYDIKVKDPRLYLVVGNKENSRPNEIIQALRQYKNEINLIDYDSIAMMLCNLK